MVDVEGITDAYDKSEIRWYFELPLGILKIWQKNYFPCRQFGEYVHRKKDHFVSLANSLVQSREIDVYM